MSFEHDGEPVLVLRVRHALTREKLADLMAAFYLLQRPAAGQAPPVPSRRAAEAFVRSHLWAHGQLEDEPGPLESATEAECAPAYEWAESVTRRLWPPSPSLDPGY